MYLRVQFYQRWQARSQGGEGGGGGWEDSPLPALNKFSLP